MKRANPAGLVAAAVLATAALGAAPAAQAHTEVYFSVGVPGLPVYVEPAPTYFRPAPVYFAPRPVYTLPPTYVYQRPWQQSNGYEFEREQAWRRAEWHRREWAHRHHDRERFPSQGRDRD